MIWSVEWLPAAENDLADLWNSSSDRAQITAAANAIDAFLEGDPLHAGEGRSGTRRLLFIEPLAVSFDVDEANKQVMVHAVWRWPES
jgi:plasmid stabilization system protein ParE